MKREITEEQYQELIKAQSTLNEILLVLNKKYDNDNVVSCIPFEGEELVKTPDNDILNKYPVEVNSFSSILQIDSYLITNKVRNIWNGLTQEEQIKSIRNAEKYKNYEKSRLKEPNLLYYLQDKKFNWKQFN